MQLPQSKFKDNVFGAEKEMNFEIDDNNSIIFDILRDKMYSDKIGSLCREVVSNARDANREAGRGDVPVEIHIIQPDEMESISDMSIVFKDYGVGITPNRMSDVFIKYAASTKRSTNSQTGGFGLGAKTPFAYTDTFTVVTICNVEGKRMKFTYTAMIDSSRKGKMILFDQEETTKKTGTQIVVPINNQDKSEFENRCIHSTMFWDIKPKLVNFTTDYPNFKIIEDNDDFSIIQSFHLSNNKYYLDIDGIGYSVNKQLCEISDSGLKGDNTIILKFDVGQLTISANREAVQYDDETVEKIKEKIEKVKQFLIKNLNNKLSESDSYLQACFNYQKIMKQNYQGEDSISNILSNAVSTGSYGSDKGILFYENNRLQKQANWKGQALKKSIKLQHHDVVFVRKPIGNSNVEYLEASNVINESWIDTPIFYMDTRKNIRRNITIWDKYKDTFFLLIPHNKNKSTQQQVIEECIELGFEYQLDIQMYSDIEKSKINPIQSTRYVKGKTVTLKHRTYKSGGYWNSDTTEFHRNKKVLWSEQSDSQLNKQYCYVVVKTLTALGNYNDRYLKRPLSHKIPYDKIDMLKLLNPSIEVMCVNKRSYDRYVSQSSMKTVEEQLQIELQSDNGLAKRYISQRVAEMTNNTFPKTFIEYFNNLLPKVAVKAVITEQSRSDKRFPSNFTEIIDVKFDFESLQKKLEKVEQKYPMMIPYIESKLELFHLRRIDDKEKQKRLDIVKKYIESVG